jgi:Domain of unknown function (DUF4272)
MMNRDRLTTDRWAHHHQISADLVLPEIADYHELLPWSARQIAIRAVILANISVVAQGEDPTLIIDWFKRQQILVATTPIERLLLLDVESIDPKLRSELAGRMEASRALLWSLGKVEILGLPIYGIRDRLEDIIPPVGADLQDFFSTAQLRSPGELLVESDRHYRLWCQYFRTYRQDKDLLPSDLDYVSLYQREYVFEWLLGAEDWDDIQCDD